MKKKTQSLWQYLQEDSKPYKKADNGTITRAFEDMIESIDRENYTNELLEGVKGTRKLH